MRPITAAASAWSRKLGPSTWPTGRPTTPARRNIATYARTLAMTQTIVCSRLTGMPSVDGPVAPLGRAADRDAEVRAPHEQAERDEADRHEDDREQVGGVEDHARERRGSSWNGGSSRGATVRSPNRLGRKSAAPVSTCATPIVATVTIRRGEW